MPDTGGEGEESLSGAGEDSGWGSAAVLCEAEPAFEGVDDGFDPLADAGDVSVSARLVRAAITSRSRILGLARHQVTGMPSAVVTRWRRKPQKKRELLRQLP